MKQTRSIFDVDDWDEAIREAKAALDADPENYTVRAYLLMLHEMKKQEEREYSAKNTRKRRGDPNSPSAPARIRAITGKNLVEFARLCGIKYETYRAIERDTKKRPLPPNAISRQNAELIALATGVCPKALLENRLISADGKTGYDYYIWFAYSQATQHEHARLESDWLGLFEGAIKEALRYDKNEPDNGSFFRVVGLAQLLDEILDVYDRPTGTVKRKRLIGSMLESVRRDIAKAAIQRSADIRKLARRRSK